MNCWLATHGYIEAGAGRLVPVRKAGLPWDRTCHTPWDWVHLIPQRDIKATFPHGAHLPLDEHRWRRIDRNANVQAIDKVRDLHELLWDERIIVQACRGHHHLFDVARKLRIPFEALPIGIHEYAAEFGFDVWLEHEYAGRKVATI